MSVTFSQPRSAVFVPDGKPTTAALARTTHLGIGAHPDDLEIFAIDGILACFHDEDHWFTGVIVADGAGSPRHGRYRGHTDERMRKVRRSEQRKAAFIGDYTAQVLLDHSSEAVKGGERAVVEDLKRVLEATGPNVVYTHSLTDKHDTHVAVALRVIQACREVSSDGRPARVLGCEVWRDLDWLPDRYKVEMKLTGDEHLQHALLGVYDSQIAGGKRYDLATLGRRRAQATFAKTHAADDAIGRVYAIDLTPLVADPRLDAAQYCTQLVEAFRREVEERVRKLGA